MTLRQFSRTALRILAVAAFLLVLTDGSWAQAPYKLLHKFNGSTDGSRPWEGVVMDGAGNLYGTTYGGGKYGDGIVFQLIPNPDGTWKEKIIHNFNGKDGAVPQAAMIFDSQGDLYGTTWIGGKGDCNGYGCGVVFELIPGTGGHWTYKVLHYFSGDVGVNPTGSLIFDKTGNLYSTTSDWSFYFTGPGTVFKLAPNANGTWTKTTIHTFGTGTDGYNPNGGLTADTAGDFYGVTIYGGAYGYGTIYELTPASDGTWTENVLYSFTAGTDGWRPQCRPISDSAGNLYGLTVFGGSHGAGTIWQLVPNPGGTWTLNTIYTFTGGNDGSNPWAGLTIDSSENLYGTTYFGGSHGCGVVFKLASNSGNSWTQTVLHTFADQPACGSFGDLIFDTAGNLYGTNPGDDTATFGSVFKVTP